MNVAFIQGGEVINLAVFPDDYRLADIEKDAGVTAMAHETAQIGWKKSGSKLVPPAAPEPGPVPVPTSITPLQARNGLRLWGFGQAEMAAFLATIEDAEDREMAEDAWEYATSIERANPLIAGFAAHLGKTDAEVDQFFRDAAAL